MLSFLIKNFEKKFWKRQKKKKIRKAKLMNIGKKRKSK